MMANSLKGVSLDAAKRDTPVGKKAVKGQVRNNTGGYVFKLDDLDRIRRFLILGSESSFYQAGKDLSLQNAETIQRVAKTAAARDVIDLIVAVSEAGRAPKQQPALFALALVISQTEDAAVKAYGYSVLNRVARTGTTFFEFLGFLGQFQRYGMGAQKAIARWYTEKSVDSLAYQLVKYRQREGFTHTDALRLSKRVKSSERPELANLLDWTVGRPVDGELPKIVEGFEKAKVALPSSIPALIREYGLSWEMIPSESLNDVKVWDALLDGNVPLGALIRQLPRLTNLGIVAPNGGRTREIEDRIMDEAALKKARIHPLKQLVALKTYSSGHGASQSWKPVRRIVDALDKSFYLAFGAVEATNKRWYLGLDVSASMTWGGIGGLQGITPREASAAMALVTAAVEREHYIAGFASNMQDTGISPRDSLDTVVRKIEALRMGGTNLSLPMMDALQKKIPVDTFVIYTDNEVNQGGHPFQALERYRDGMGINSKLIVVGMTATRFSIANPNDTGMLDIAGFDTAAPNIMAEFAAG